MSDNIETAKKRYSQQLAAYTRQQFRVAQSALEAARAANGTNGDSRPRAAAGEDSGRHRSRSRDSHRTRNFRVVDFAQKAPLVNGTA
ncbi:hypothetical protein A7U60_g7853 [Sanghuangporus baumii]|uniref:Uncharacterized protein n=1 Tax=Sanghuangporus baumii TaxID=108892 RepID=A0A9Q5HSJ6_SANBA|nr:hypothetical protein A7U60_g7853 [Sanghuangporus baumii]